MLTNPFLKAMTVVEGTLSILDNNCIVYSRIWCIYEFFMSVMSRKQSYKFDIYTDYNLNHALGISDVVHGVKFLLDRILKILKNIDVSKATVQEDVKYIKHHH